MIIDAAGVPETYRDFYAAAPEGRAATIAGLRQLADWLEGHPDVPVPLDVDVLLHTSAEDDYNGRQAVRKIAAAMGRPMTVKRTAYEAAVSFGPVRFRVVHVMASRMGAHEALMSYRDNVQVTP